MQRLHLEVAGDAADAEMKHGVISAAIPKPSMRFLSTYKLPSVWQSFIQSIDPSHRPLAWLRNDHRSNLYEDSVELR